MTTNARRLRRLKLAIARGDAACQHLAALLHTAEESLALRREELRVALELGGAAVRGDPHP